MADFTVDTSDLTALADDLDAAPAKASGAMRATTQVALRKIRDDGRTFASGLSFLPHLPSTITYETHDHPWGVSGEAGPENRGQGSLGHLIEYGTPTSAPHAYMAPAFDRELPEWIKHLEAAAGDVL